jgi:hypothetical protein
MAPAARKGFVSRWGYHPGRRDKKLSPMFYGYRSILPTLVVALLLGACATVNWDYPRMRSSAFAYPETTSVGALFQEAAAKYPGLSGFSLLNIGRALFSPG